MPFLSYMNTKTMIEAGEKAKQNTVSFLKNTMWALNTSFWPDLRTLLHGFLPGPSVGSLLVGGLSKIVGISVELLSPHQSSEGLQWVLFYVYFPL